MTGTVLYTQLVIHKFSCKRYQSLYMLTLFIVVDLSLVIYYDL